MKEASIGLVVLMWVLALSAVAVSAAPVTHCDGSGDPALVKVEGQGTFVVDGLVVTVDGATVSFADEFGDPVVMEFCVKASTGISEMVTGSSFTVDWLNNGEQTPDISYVILYGPGEECPEESCEPPSES